MNVIAIASLLHEGPINNSATRRFRSESVLSWTLRRIARTQFLQKSLVLAWDDQLDAILELGINARACGPRRPIGLLDATTAAQRWAEGWRGGLLQTCWFDKGFVGQLVMEALTDESADAVVWVDPAAGLVDPQLLDELVVAGTKGPRDFYFMQAAPGLGGVLFKRALIQKLTTEHALPGRLVHYLPEAPILDPVTSETCVPVPLPVSRTIDRFTLDSRRQIERIERATMPLNGTLMSSESLTLAARMATIPAAGAFPREVVVETTVRRNSEPIFNPATHLPIDRPDISVEAIENIVRQLSGWDDLRITLAGVGDPLCHPEFEALLNAVKHAGAVTVETDLIDVSDGRLKMLAESGIDVIAVHLPATDPGTYAEVMGVDAMGEVVENIRLLLTYRNASEQGVPLIVPLFHKLAMNLEEMEVWYDTWLRAIGNAVILGPSRFGGRLPDLAAVDMTPTIRKPCARIQQRLTILSNGSITTCEEDVLGEMAIGHVGTTTIADAWNGMMNDLRGRHQSLTSLPVLCGNCSEWYRP